MPYYGYYGYNGYSGYYGSSNLWLLILFAAILLSIFAQIRIKSQYRNFSHIANSRGLTGAQAAEEILHNHGIFDVRVTQVAGDLTDHYDPTAKELRLSGGVYGSSSIAAIGIAAHEAGHAVQHNVGYVPIKIRSTLVPIANIGSSLALPIALIGFIFTNSETFINIGIILYLAVFAFHLVTLPVEFNASYRAVKVLPSMGFDQEDVKGTRKILTAAALTYVAAMLSSLAQLLRLMSMRGRRR